MNEFRAYLYMIDKDDTLSVHEGRITYGRYPWTKQGYFTTDDNQRYFVSSEPSKLYYRKVWLQERDDNLAKKLYIEYHERKIKELEHNIELHKKAIKTFGG